MTKNWSFGLLLCLLFLGSVAAVHDKVNECWVCHDSIKLGFIDKSLTPSSCDKWSKNYCERQYRLDLFMVRACDDFVKYMVDVFNQQDEMLSRRWRNYLNRCGKQSVIEDCDTITMQLCDAVLEHNDKFCENVHMKAAEFGFRQKLRRAVA